MKSALIVLGFFELLIAGIIFIVAVPQLLIIEKNLGTNFISSAFINLYFLMIFVVAIVQVLVGVFSFDSKLGKRITIILLFVGVILSLLILPGTYLFIAGPIL